MNFKTLPLFIALFFFSALPAAYAQADVDPAPSNAQNGAKPAAQEQSIYARATDEQLKEAQKYYGICTSNKAISDLKNCKCAATKYLETRLELGDQATTKEIVLKNAETCLKNPKSNVTGKSLNPAGKSYDDIPQAYLREANEVFEFCTKDQGFSINFDCQCYAAKFLSAREEHGKKVSKNQIMQDLKNNCRNVVGTTGNEYTNCMSVPVDIGMGDSITQKDYCECFAHEWARQYKHFDGNIDNRAVQREFRFAANMRCRNPSMYK